VLGRGPERELETLSLDSCILLPALDAVRITPIRLRIKKNNVPFFPFKEINAHFPLSFPFFVHNLISSCSAGNRSSYQGTFLLTGHSPLNYVQYRELVASAWPHWSKIPMSGGKCGGLLIKLEMVMSP
jgi:hypothetical protein